MRNQFFGGLAIYSIALAAVFGGCQKNSPPPNQAMEGTAQLAQGYEALEARQYDAAIAQADAYLQKVPAGIGSADAMYLKGRAIEQRPAADITESQANLKSAGNLYQQALGLKPAPRTEAYIRASLANVKFFQDDYNDALSQWSTAYEKITEPDVQAVVLYRIGICQQRLGRFTDADRTFAAVQQRYPKSSVAAAAKAHAGARQFWVQLATFKSTSGADKAVAELLKQGVTVQRSSDSQGRTVLRVGPLTTYDQARATKAKFTSTYADAMIVP